MAIKKKYLKVLQEIDERAPKELLDNLMKKTSEFETIKIVLQKAINDPEAPEEKKPIWQNLLDSGEFDGEVEIEDPEIAKQLDFYYSYEIERAIKLGKLPEDRELLGKLKKNGRKKTKNSGK